VNKPLVSIIIPTHNRFDGLLLSLESISKQTFKDYEFTLEELAPFTRFQVKIDMVGTNQAQPPLNKELRAIAVA